MVLVQAKFAAIVATDRSLCASIDYQDDLPTLWIPNPGIFHKCAALASYFHDRVTLTPNRVNRQIDNHLADRCRAAN